MWTIDGISCCVIHFIDRFSNSTWALAVWTWDCKDNKVVRRWAFLLSV